MESESLATGHGLGATQVQRARPSVHRRAPRCGGVGALSRRSYGGGLGGAGGRGGLVAACVSRGGEGAR
eukprot:5572268-Prymnesium_polylepis.1